MAILSNGEPVAAPSPGLMRYGLFSAATVTEDLSARGIAAGIQFPGEDCGVVRSYDANCATHPEKTFDEGLPYMEATPYWVYASRQCGTLGVTAAEFDASVRRRLLANEQREVESQLWGGGAVAADPNLTGVAGVTSVVPAVPGAAAAIAALEDSFYDEYGYVGTIHISMRAYGNLAYSNLLVRNGGTLNTPMGSVWSIGAGYGITGPAGDAPDAGTVWAFMTPPVHIRRSGIVQRPAWEVADRSVNQFRGLAERVYTHAWACDAVHAVQVPYAAPAVEAVTTP
jgi:hypothetical protein